MWEFYGGLGMILDPSDSPSEKLWPNTHDIDEMLHETTKPSPILDMRCSKIKV